MSFIPEFDEAVVLHWNTFITDHPWLNQIVLFIAQYGVYAIPVIWVAWWFLTGKKQRFTLLSSLLAGIVAWQILNRVIKVFYFHPRPIHTLELQEFLFERPENSFPSDHVAFLAGIAFFFLLRKQKEGWWLLGLALLVGICRIAVAVHYPTDIFVGLITGLIAAWFVRLFHPWLCDRIWEPLISLARKLHLA